MGCFDLNELSQNAHGRAGMGRRNNGLNWTNAIKNCKNNEDKVKKMQDTLMRKPKLIFFATQCQDCLEMKIAQALLDPA